MECENSQKSFFLTANINTQQKKSKVIFWRLAENCILNIMKKSISKHTENHFLTTQKLMRLKFIERKKFETKENDEND